MKLFRSAGSFTTTLLLLIFHCNVTVSAQSSEGNTEERNISILRGSVTAEQADSLKVELNTPTVPAGAILGDDSLALTSLRSSADLFGQLLTGIGTDGSFQPGIAIGGAPYWWFGPAETLEDYRNSPYLLTLLKRTQLGVATRTVPDESNDTDVKLGVSLSWQLIRKQDPRFSANGEACLGRALHQTVDAIQEQIQNDEIKAIKPFGERLRTITQNALSSYPDGNLSIGQINEIREIGLRFSSFEESSVSQSFAKFRSDSFEKYTVLEKIYFEEVGKVTSARLKENEKTLIELETYATARDKCRRDFNEELRNTNSLSLTVASAFGADGGRFDDISEEETAFWLAYKSGWKVKLDENIQLPLQAFVGYTLDENVEVTDDVIERADQLTVGVGTSFESNDFNIDFQIAYINTNFNTDRDTSSDYRITFALGYRIADATWLELRAGTTNSDEIEESPFVGLNLKIDAAALLNNN